MKQTKKEKEERRRYYQANKERIREYHRKWREANPDKTKKYSKEYYATPKGIQNRKKNQIKYYWNHLKEKRRYAKERWRMKHNKCLECGSKEIAYTKGSTNYKPINNNIWSICTNCQNEWDLGSNIDWCDRCENFFQKTHKCFSKSLKI